MRCCSIETVKNWHLKKIKFLLKDWSRKDFDPVFVYLELTIVWSRMHLATFSVLISNMNRKGEIVIKRILFL